MSKSLIILLTSVALTACSHQTWYQIGQDYQRQKCINDAQTVQQYNECNELQRQSYKEYEKQRNIVIDNGL